MTWLRARKKPIVIQFREVEGVEHIATREGILTSSEKEDFVIKGVEGELYPIKKTIFKKTYDIESKFVIVCPSCAKLVILDVHSREFRCECKAITQLKKV